MSNFIIYHNPRCSKSRQTLALLHEKGCEPKIFLYLEEELTFQDLKEILQKLNMEPRDLLRKGEEEYKKNNLSNKKLAYISDVSNIYKKDYKYFLDRR